MAKKVLIDVCYLNFILLTTKNDQFFHATPFLLHFSQNHLRNRLLYETNAFWMVQWMEWARVWMELLHLYLLKLFLTTVNVMQAISNGIQSIIYLEANGKNNIHTLSHSIVVRVSSVTYPLVFFNFRTVTSNSSQILVWFFFVALSNRRKIFFIELCCFFRSSFLPWNEIRWTNK